MTMSGADDSTRKGIELAALAVYKPCGNKLGNCVGDKSAVVLQKNNEF